MDFRQLAEARVFWFDWVFGLLVASHVLAAGKVSAYLPQQHGALPVRWCAGVSFLAYLFHLPLLDLCAAFLPAGNVWLAVGITLPTIAILGTYAEQSKIYWKRGLTFAAAGVFQADARPMSSASAFGGIRTDTRART